MKRLGTRRRRVRKLVYLPKDGQLKGSELGRCKESGKKGFFLEYGEMLASFVKAVASGER